jgi:hypothetical protein
MWWLAMICAGKETHMVTCGHTQSQNKSKMGGGGEPCSLAKQIDQAAGGWLGQGHDMGPEMSPCLDLTLGQLRSKSSTRTWGLGRVQQGERSHIHICERTNHSQGISSCMHPPELIQTQ